MPRPPIATPRAALRGAPAPRPIPFASHWRTAVSAGREDVRPACRLGSSRAKRFPVLAELLRIEVPLQRIHDSRRAIESILGISSLRARSIGNQRAASAGSLPCIHAPCPAPPASGRDKSVDDHPQTGRDPLPAKDVFQVRIAHDSIGRSAARPPLPRRHGPLQA